MSGKESKKNIVGVVISWVIGVIFIFGTLGALFSKAMRSQEKIKEIKCTCNKCKKVWHYLPKDERGQKTEEFGKDLIASTACCCNPIGILVGGLRKRPRPLDQCPSCNSKDVSKKEIYYEKKS